MLVGTTKCFKFALTTTTSRAACVRACGLAHVSADRKARWRSSERPRLASRPLWCRLPGRRGGAREGASVPEEAGSCPSLIVLSMVRTEETGLLRQKTQVGGRSSRAVMARPMVCSALGGELRGDRESPRQQRLIEGATLPNFLFCLRVSLGVSGFL